MLSIAVLSLKGKINDWGTIIKMINMYGSALGEELLASSELRGNGFSQRFDGLKCLLQVRVLKT